MSSAAQALGRSQTERSSRISAKRPGAELAAEPRRTRRRGDGKSSTSLSGHAGNG
jgi:hypothetical protein